MAVKAEEVAEKIEKNLPLSKEEEVYVKSTPKSSDPAQAVIEEEAGEEEKTDFDKPSGIKKEGDKKPGIDAPEKSEQPEESPSEKKAPAKTADAKPSDEVSADVKTRLEAELAKPEGLEDLTDFSQRERAYFFQMRKDRSRRQKVEEENELLKFERLQGQLKEKQKPAAPEKGKAAPEIVEEEEEADPLEGRDPEDLLTVKDVQTILAKQGKKAPAANENEAFVRGLYLRNQMLEARLTLKEKNVNDLDDIIGFAQEALGGDEDAKAYISRVADNGGNVVLATYNQIKASAKWPEIEKAVRVAKGKKAPTENKERAERLEKNENKVRTTGAGGGGGGDESDEYTVGEVIEMPTEDFAKLPKEKRRAIMEKYGSTPNRSV